MNIRQFNKEDYETVISWAKDKGVDFPPLDFLSENGIIVDGKCACFLYVGNSRVCLVEALIANPNIDKIDRDLSLKFMFDYIINLVKENEYKYICCSVETEVLKERLKESNFIISEKPSYLGLRVL